MNLSVKSLIGKPLLFQNKAIGNVSALLFSCDTGRFLAVASDKNKHYSATIVQFEDGGDIFLTSQEEYEGDGKNWIGFRVESSEEKNHLGDVTDVEFDTNLSVIRRIMVTKSVFGLPFVRHIYSFERIVDVQEKTVFLNIDTKEKQQDFCPMV